MTTTRVQMIIETLRDNPERRFTARELAKEFLVRYLDDLSEKRLNPRYRTDEEFVNQLAAEIGAGAIGSAKRQCKNIATRDKPRPRIYYWEPNPEKIQQAQAEMIVPELIEPVVVPAIQKELTEHELYPLLIEFLHKEHKLYCQRIDERPRRTVTVVAVIIGCILTLWLWSPWISIGMRW